MGEGWTCVVQQPCREQPGVNSAFLCYHDMGLGEWQMLLL